MIKEEIPNVLKVLSETYQLKELTSKNWKKYYEVIYQYLNDENKVEWYAEGNEKLELAKDFFDYYENEEKNEELLQILQSVNGPISEEEKLECALMLPYTAPLAAKVDEIKNEIQQKIVVQLEFCL